MKINSIMKKTKSYLKELTIVTMGVLIALIISNYKENNQARKYQIASIEIVKNEVEANYTILNGVIESQTKLMDTINKYSKDHVSINDLFQKAGGLQGATLSNTGLEFYTRNEFNLIDFEMMSTLIQMKSTSKLMDTKLEKLMDFVYPNLHADSKDSKELVNLYISNILNSEKQLIHYYENFIDEYIETKHDTK